MAIDGRINVDVLFHDTDGTASLKVVSLEDSTAYTSGQVSIVTGTVGTSSQSILSTDYRDASGQPVTISTVTRVALRSSTASEVRYLVSASPEIVGLVSRGDVCIGNVPAAFPNLTSHRLRSVSGTASYTLVLYGT